MVARCPMKAAAPMLLFALAPATAKTVTGTVTLSSQVTEEFMAKFSFSPNLASLISGTFHTDRIDYFDGHPHDMALCLYDEEKWAAFQQALKKGSLCAERRQMASWSTKIKPTLQDDKARHEFSFRSSLRPTDSSTAHYWFAVLMDCYLEEYDAHPPLMHYELKFLNGRSHLPADQDGMATVNGLLCVGMAGYGVIYFGLAILQMHRKGQVHLLILLFAAAYTMQTSGVFFEWLHLWHYRRDGASSATSIDYKGGAFDFASALLQCASELTISVVLIALAFGWTLGLEAQAPLEGYMGKLLSGLHAPGKLLRGGIQSPSVVLLCLIAGLQVMLLTIGRSLAEGSDQFHDFEHWPGLVLLSLRLLLCATFFWALRRSVKMETDAEVLALLHKLAGFGGLWFLCLPLLILVANVVPPYRRHQLVAGGSTVVQAVTLVLLSTLFKEGSHYYRLSSLAHLGSGFAMGSAFASKGGLGKKVAVD